MEEKIKTIMAEILDINEDELTPDFGPENTGEWDSINNLRMITAIEAEFDISFSMADIQAMENFSIIVSTVKRYCE